ncbi:MULTISPECIES: hypothetical protein [unclassified Caballeronia]|uniref:hypothetical protein n=1 Tax=unclassified Caballeronia TaxID=2646786 RepID=UPI0020294123|nr:MULTISPECIES: hypothetical protein [unclassified Caballeronia]
MNAVQQAIDLSRTLQISDKIFLRAKLAGTLLKFNPLQSYEMTFESERHAAVPTIASHLQGLSAAQQLDILQTYSEAFKKFKGDTLTFKKRNRFFNFIMQQVATLKQPQSAFDPLISLTSYLKDNRAEWLDYGQRYKRLEAEIKRQPMSNWEPLLQNMIHALPGLSKDESLAACTRILDMMERMPPKAQKELLQILCQEVIWIGRSRGHIDEAFEAVLNYANKKGLCDATWFTVALQNIDLLSDENCWTRFKTIAADVQSNPERYQRQCVWIEQMQALPVIVNRGLIRDKKDRDEVVAHMMQDLTSSKEDERAERLALTAAILGRFDLKGGAHNKKVSAVVSDVHKLILRQCGTIESDDKREALLVELIRFHRSQQSSTMLRSEAQSHIEALMDEIAKLSPPAGGEALGELVLLRGLPAATDLRRSEMVDKFIAHGWSTITANVSQFSSVLDILKSLDKRKLCSAISQAMRTRAKRPSNEDVLIDLEKILISIFSADDVHRHFEWIMEILKREKLPTIQLRGIASILSETDNAVLPLDKWTEIFGLFSSKIESLLKQPPELSPIAMRRSPSENASEIPIQKADAAHERPGSGPISVSECYFIVNIIDLLLGRLKSESSADARGRLAGPLAESLLRGMEAQPVNVRALLFKSLNRLIALMVPEKRNSFVEKALPHVKAVAAAGQTRSLIDLCANINKAQSFKRRILMNEVTAIVVKESINNVRLHSELLFDDRFTLSEYFDRKNTLMKLNLKHSSASESINWWVKTFIQEAPYGDEEGLDRELHKIDFLFQNRPLLFLPAFAALIEANYSRPEIEELVDGFVLNKINSLKGEIEFEIFMVNYEIGILKKADVLPDVEIFEIMERIKSYDPKNRLAILPFLIKVKSSDARWWEDSSSFNGGEVGAGRLNWGISNQELDREIKAQEFAADRWDAFLSEVIGQIEADESGLNVLAEIFKKFSLPNLRGRFPNVLDLLFRETKERERALALLPTLIDFVGRSSEERERLDGFKMVLRHLGQAPEEFKIKFIEIIGGSFARLPRTLHFILPLCFEVLMRDFPGEAGPNWFKLLESAFGFSDVTLWEKIVEKIAPSLLKFTTTEVEAFISAIENSGKYTSLARDGRSVAQRAIGLMRADVRRRIQEGK